MNDVRAVVASLAAMSLTSACHAADCVSLERPPVVFVHGSGLKASAWDSMREAMIGRGYPKESLHAIQLEPDDGANVRAAERFIRPAVDGALTSAAAAAKTAGCRAPQRVDLIAHSMGAVSARWYAARIAPQRVRTFVGIAAANHGTDALCGYNGDGNREMCPAFAKSARESAVQFELNGSATHPRDETPYGAGVDSANVPRVAPEPSRTIEYFTVRTEPDEWIRPASSASLDGAGGRPWPPLPAHARETSPGNLLWGTPISHDSLPMDSEVIATVISLLREGAVP
jgi:pimeloyl-ACP methyl ester carboxylesterase